MGFSHYLVKNGENDDKKVICSTTCLNGIETPKTGIWVRQEIQLSVKTFFTKTTFVRSVLN